MARRTRARFFLWATLSPIVLLAFALALGNAYRLYGKFRLSRDLPAPGRLVSIGDHRLHIHCVGEGRPVTVLVAGAGRFSTDWARVMDLAEPITRVCAYDRSGLGWSEIGSSYSATMSTARGEFEALLRESGEAAPYILVGHSRAGVFVWLYAQDHPEQTAGVVTLDGSPPAPVAADASRPAAASDPDGASRPRENRGRSWNDVKRFAFVRLERLGLMPMISEIWGDELPIPVEYVPPVPLDAFPEAAAQVVRRTERFCERCFADLLLGAPGSATRTMHDLGNLPLVVIARGMPERNPNVERSWRRRQEAMSRLSTSGRLIIADASRHYIHYTQPEIVAEAIDRLAADYRAEHRAALSGGETAHSGLDDAASNSR